MSSQAEPKIYRSRGVPLAVAVLMGLGCVLFAGFWVSLLTGVTFAEAHDSQSSQFSLETPMDANHLASVVVQNELKAEAEDKSLWKYRDLEQKDGKVELREVVETKDGEVHRVLALDGQPLTGKRREQENERLQNVLTHPDRFREQQKDRVHDAEQSRKLLEMLPEAFRYQYAGTRDGDIILRFRPNPAFHPSDHEGEVFHHMEGTLLVDRRLNRMAGLEGTLTSPVKFWGGVLGHLDQGGTFIFRQKDVGAGHWEMTDLSVQMNGKALFLKTIAVREKEVHSDFHQLPETTTLKQAANFLEVSDRAREAGF
jgi:hypothetical protein